jgi:hypothetical protein
MDTAEQNNIIIYQTENGDIEIDIKIENETVWMTQKNMSLLFGVEVPSINKHIKNILDDEEIDLSTISKMEIVQKEGIRNIKREVEFYNLDMIISVGYRVNSITAIHFRRWATKTLKEYLAKGFVLDDDRLKGKSNKYLDELIQRIREIRASELNFYQKIREAFTISIDYNTHNEESKNFFATIQNKLIYATTNKTAPQIIKERANENKKNMGLTSFEGSVVRKVDIYISKNYLHENELKKLERFVVMFLDYVENYIETIQKPLYMKDWIDETDRFIIFNRYPLLNNKSIVSRKDIDNEVEKTYKIFDSNRKLKQKEEADKEDLREMEKVEKKIRK